MHNLCEKDFHVAHIHYASTRVNKQPVPLFDFYIGDQVTLSFIIFDEQGTEENLTGCDILFKCKKDIFDEDYIVEYSTSCGGVIFSNREKGYIKIEFEDADVISLEEGAHRFDILKVKDNKTTHILRDYISLKS